MADKKISQLTAATTPLAGTEVVPVVQSGVTKKVSVADLTAGRSVSVADLTASIGNLVIGTSGKGIDFSATPGTGTSELFSDYEEGTFTPTFSGLTIGNGTAQGRYTKIGRSVTVEVWVLWGSTTSASGSWHVTNLPFTSAATHRGYGTGNILDNGTENYACLSIVSEGGTNLYFAALGAGSTYTSYTNTTATVPMTWTTGDAVRVSVTYQT